MDHVRQGEALGASYRFVELLGTGAVGEVWRVSALQGGPDLAAKILRAEHSQDPDLIERFIRERSLLLTLHHPNIVAVRDLVVEGDRLAIVMDLVAGGSLRELREKLHTFPAADALRLCAEVLDAVAFAHTHNTAHRDIKPDNVLLAAPWEPGSTGLIRVTDFGIASVFDSRERHTTALVGTPQYMSPELLSEGIAGAPADVYATGIMLYELLCGHTPFVGSGTDFTVAYRQVTAAPPRIAIPDSLWEVLEQLLSKDPAQRPSAAQAAALLRQSAQELAEFPAVEMTGTAIADPVGTGGDIPNAPAPRSPDSAVPADPAAATVDPGSAITAPDRPATVIRGSRADLAGPRAAPSDGAPQGELPGAGSPPMAEVPDLGPADSATIFRPLHPRPRRAPSGLSSPESEASTHPASRLGPLSWRNPRVLGWGAVGVLALAGVVCGVVFLTPAASENPADRPADAHSTATQQDVPLPTGLGISREARYDTQAQSVALTVTYTAQKAPLTGPLLEVVPGATEDAPCLAVTWGKSGATRNLVSTTGIAAECGWSVDHVAIPASGTVTVSATIPLALHGDHALDNWLASVAAATSAAIRNPAVVGTAYPVQRLQNVIVQTPSRAVSQTTLPVTLVPVWPSGSDPVNPLYVSPATGKTSAMLNAIAGGEKGVRFSDGCSGGLAVSSDGFVVTALAVSPHCVLRAGVGNFTDLASDALSVTTR